MADQNLLDAADLFRQCNEILAEANRIQHSQLREAAVEAAKPIVNRCAQQALEYLRNA